MAEGFEPYHVPQQSRRDKLRVLSSQTSLIPLIDPSFLSSDLLSSAAHHFNKPIPAPLAKQQGLNLMPFVNSSSSSSASSDVVTASTHHHHQCLDPQSCSFPLNPTSFLDINAASHPFLFNQLRDFDHSFDASVTEPLRFKSHALSSTSAQALSLSLSSHHTHQPNLPLELNLQRYGATVYATDKVSSSTGDGGYSVAGIVGSSSNLTSNEPSRSSVPLGPFTGYAFILKGSKFLKPAQQLLGEFCDVGRDIYGEKFTADSSLMDHSAECLSACGVACDPHCRDGGDGGRKTSRLISMLDEVCRRYKHYYQQTQAVMASFECVAGLSNAAPYAYLAFKAMSKHFRSLKNAITDQLHFNSKGHSQVSHGKQDATRFGNSDKGFYVQRPGQSSGLGEHQPVWRPQRGLPERAVTVLRAWLFEHFLHPYPTDTDKLMLAKQTGLSRSQVSNWFINARVRLWKPMVEEIHMLETRQARKTAQREEKNSNKSSEQPPVSCSAMSDNPSTSGQRVQDIPPKRTKNGLLDMAPGNEEALNLSYNNMSNHPPPGVGIGTICGSSGVSLTLGLHHSNGMALSEPFPMNAAQRFGLGPETDTEGFVMGGFQVQNRHFGGHLMHDFVG